MRRLLATLCFLLVLAGCSCGPTYEISGEEGDGSGQVENAGEIGRAHV